MTPTVFMEVIADLHIHSMYSRATSPRMNIEGIADAALKKGITLMGTGDFTHPKWMKELEKMEFDGEFYIYRDVYFVPTVEVSLIYPKLGRVRKVHVVIVARDLDEAKRVSSFLGKSGRLDYDGRPIFGMKLEELFEGLDGMDVEIFPAHAWTPWFSIFGSKSGFDSLEDAAGEWKGKIHAIETGLSSDPEMNGLLSQLDGINLVSNSDAHSPEKIGREANIFEWRSMKWKFLLDSIRKGKGFVATIEVDPAFGKYHFDGHRKCGVSIDPRKVKSTICPKCGKELTLGVLRRVVELADRKEPEIKRPFYRILPLDELLAALFGTTAMSKKVRGVMEKAYSIGNELHVLLKADAGEIEERLGKAVASAIIKNREGKIKIIPGYDGVYGKPVISSLDSFMGL